MMSTPLGKQIADKYPELQKLLLEHDVELHNLMRVITIKDTLLMADFMAEFSKAYMQSTQRVLQFRKHEPIKLEVSSDQESASRRLLSATLVLLVGWKLSRIP